MRVQIFSKRFLMPFSNLRPQVWFSRRSKEPSLNFQLFPCTSHMRFGKPSSSFNVISNRAFILDASPSWLAFLPNKCYPMAAISHRESAKAAQQCWAIYHLNFVRAHAPKQCKRQKREQYPFLIDRKRISVHQALFLHAGYQATALYTLARLLFMGVSLRVSSCYLS